MTWRTLCLLAVVGNLVAVGIVRAQIEQPPGVRPGAPGAPGTAGTSGASAVSGPEKRYVEMSHSKDRVLKATAERYLSLIRFQEWTGASGKSQIAKYVSHEPDLSRVQLSISSGTGKERATKEVDVEVMKLNKVCQARVKQIDVLQKRLEELAAAAVAKGETFASANESVVTPEISTAGPEPVTAGPEGSGAPPQAVPVEDPSASEPDPLGFAELPPVEPPSAPGVAPGPM